MTTTLAPMDSAGKSGKLTEAKGPRAPVEGCHEFTRLGIELDDITNAAVVDFFALNLNRCAAPQPGAQVDLARR